MIDYLERRLPAADQLGMEAHFRDCPECEEFFRGYRSTVALIRNLRSDSVPIPEPVRQRLRAFLSRNRASA